MSENSLDGVYFEAVRNNTGDENAEASTSSGRRVRNKMNWKRNVVKQARI